MGIKAFEEYSFVVIKLYMLPSLIRSRFNDNHQEKRKYNNLRNITLLKVRNGLNNVTIFPTTLFPIPSSTRGSHYWCYICHMGLCRHRAEAIAKNSVLPKP